MTVVADALDVQRDPAAHTASLQHVLRELERIDVLLRHEVTRARALIDGDEALRGLYIDEAEVDALIVKPLGAPHWLNAKRIHPDVRGAVAAMAEEIELWKRELGPVEPLRLDILARRFALSEFDRDVSVLCLAPVLDLGYERLFSYLHDDVTKRLATVALVLDVLTDGSEERIAALDRFSPDAPLVHHHLVSVKEDPGRGPDSPLARQIRIDDRIASYLLGSDGIDPRLRDVAQLIRGGVALAELVVAEAASALLESVAIGNTSATVVYLHGPYGVGRHTAAAAVSAALGRPLLAVDVAALPHNDAEFAELAALALRESDLQGAAMLWHGFEVLMGEAAHRRRRLLIELLEELWLCSGDGTSLGHRNRQ